MDINSGHERRAIGANRVRIPSKYRTLLGNDVYAMPGADGCFLLVPERNVGLILEKYRDNDPLLSEYKELRRYINRKMTKVDVDTQGRITLTPEVKQLCKGMNSTLELEFCGMDTYVEVWPAPVYDKKFADESDDDFDDLIASLRARLNKG